ncbi:2-acylglycerol O-acyltransferase 1-like [Frankliniella occidentalis]|uniref:2-acylglycerol O-acyltransferase 1-like n=1 Tax=Frankliniella occidentalis TaxID=133901 RepID=A0A9C6XV02_FRAOC|nr:2-acylglycerol O-acyltransferase 1-like [Frankliniella occidentalis]
MEVLGVKWAPLNTPLQRRLQTLSVVVWFVTFVFGGLLGWAGLALAALYTRYWWLVLAYLVWMYVDRNTCETGGRR